MRFMESKGVVVPNWVIWTILIAIISTSVSAIYSSARVVTQVEYIVLEMKDMKKDIDKNSDKIFKLVEGN